MSLHQPVLLSEVITAMGDMAGKRVVDGTFGAGGYTRAFLDAGASVTAFDRDPTAIAAGREAFVDQGTDLTLVESPFDQLGDVLAPGSIDAAVFDIGVSSMQLDQAGRGFSFMADGPLDMRMGEGASAAEFLAQVGEADLADVIYQYGEERRSRALAKRIVERRRDHPVETTGELAQIAESVLGRAGKIHPATRLFQALRIFVNDELGQLVRALIAAEKSLIAGGRLVLVAFHSLEDRIVKRFFAEAAGTRASGSRHEPMTVGPVPTFAKPDRAVRPSAAEIDGNARARSATLRAATRNATPPGDWSEARLAGLGIPPLVLSPLQRAWSA